MSYSQAHRNAQRLVNREWGAINRDARRAYRTGRL
jgi:hypothetical protein